MRKIEKLLFGLFIIYSLVMLQGCLTTPGRKYKTVIHERYFTYDKNITRPTEPFPPLEERAVQ